jgi:hypothetical protein
MAMGDQRHASVALPEGKGPRAGLDRRKISTPTGIRSPERPACSESLYRLSYSGPQIFPRILGFKMLKWGFEIGKRIKELVGGLNVIYRISDYINTMVEPFWKTESEVYYEELSSFKPKEKGML